MRIKLHAVLGVMQRIVVAAGLLLVVSVLAWNFAVGTVMADFYDEYKSMYPDDVMSRDVPAAKRTLWLSQIMNLYFITKISDRYCGFNGLNTDSKYVKIGMFMICVPLCFRFKKREDEVGDIVHSKT